MARDDLTPDEQIAGVVAGRLAENGHSVVTTELGGGLVDDEVRSLLTGGYICTPDEWNTDALVERGYRPHT